MKLIFWMVLFAWLGAPILTQDDDGELKRIADMARRCRAESNKFREAGGRAGDPGDPALKWSAVFWQYAKEHAGSPAGAQATAHGLGWLMFANQDQEVIAKARLLPLDFPLWGSIIEKLRLSSTTTGNYSAFRDITGRLLDQSKDNKLRAAVQLGLGRSYQEQHQSEKARAAFQAALREAPDTPLAEEAELLLNEMQNLQVGQPVPAFDAQTIDGKRISSTGLRGKVVLLTVWATW
jgi:tetratricopeptide (TPR) repeat protein